MYKGSGNVDKWRLSAGVCINEKNEILMVLQGRPEEEKKWAVPAGVLKQGETFEEACKREFYEETGYKIDIKEKFHIKENDIAIIQYFLVDIIGGEMTIQDPEQLIYDIKWRNVEEMDEEEFGFPEDKQLLLKILKQQVTQ